MSRYFVDPDKDRIVWEDMYLVRLEKSDGEVIESLEPKRLFPVSDPDRYITLMDKKLKERAIIRDIKELKEDSAQAIEKCFHDIYFVPVITKVLTVAVKSNAMVFTVETDRGNTEFSIANSVRTVKSYDDGSMTLRDTNDNRYFIPDVNKMDKLSRHFLFSFR